MTRRMARSVYRVSSAENAHVLAGTSLIDAIREPPRTAGSYVYDARGHLARASKRDTWRWEMTARGAARIAAEADGWLEIFLRGERAFGRAVRQ